MQAGRIGKLSGRLMTVSLKVFEKIVQRRVFMMICSFRSLRSLWDAAGYYSETECAKSLGMP